MACGTPLQSSQMAEGIPGFLDTFFSDFPAPLGPESLLPWDVPGKVLSLEEVEGELLELAGPFLRNRNAAPYLASSLAHEAVSQLLQTDLSEYRKLSQQEEEENQEEEETDPVTLLDARGVARNFFNQLWEVCSRWQKQVSLATQGPQRQWLVSVHAIRNTRRKMEDRHVCLPTFNQLFGLSDSVNRAYFAVFDGHGGVDAARYAAVHVHAQAAHQPELPTRPAEALRLAIQSTDRMFLRKARRERLQSGTTGVCALVAGQTLHVAWLGDSQAILVQQGQVVKLMEPHRPERQDERERIEALGGFVSHMDCWRVNGTLAVSRAIGDVFQKPYVSGDADATSWELKGSEDYLLLACDGFFDVVPHQEVSGLVQAHLAVRQGCALRIAEDLVTEARERGSHDNITVMVVFLRNPRDLLEARAQGAGDAQANRRSQDLSSGPQSWSPLLHGKARGSSSPGPSQALPRQCLRTRQVALGRAPPAPPFPQDPSPLCHCTAHLGGCGQLGTWCLPQLEWASEIPGNLGT